LITVSATLRLGITCSKLCQQFDSLCSEFPLKPWNCLLGEFTVVGNPAVYIITLHIFILVGCRSLQWTILYNLLPLLVLLLLLLLRYWNKHYKTKIAVYRLETCRSKRQEIYVHVNFVCIADINTCWYHLGNKCCYSQWCSPVHLAKSKSTHLKFETCSESACKHLRTDSSYNQFMRFC